MGSGIAQVSAVKGVRVNLVDSNEKSLQKASKAMTASLSKVAKKKFDGDDAKMKDFVDKTMSNVQMMSDMDAAVADVDLVVEAVSENLALKQKLFAQMDAVAKKETIFASNTSSLSITDIASSTKRLDRFGGLHFFSPVPMMKLVEVIKTKDTSDATFKALMEFGAKVGKVPVECKDTAGFIVNRLLIPFMTDAVRMAERGDASKKDIDIAMKLGTGHPMGPFELSDFVGLDVTLAILEGWMERYPDDDLFKPPDSLVKLVKEGKLGRKTGEGFYKY